MLIRHRRLATAPRVAAPALLLTALLAGCAHTGKPKPAAPPAAPTAAPVTAPTPPPMPDVPLSTIVNRDLQHGHFDLARQELQHLLDQHPDDRYAHSLLRQIDEDPVRLLGPQKRSHVVRAGESYSTIAAQYLGDATLFVALARYNHANDPSMLQAGVNLHLPAGPDPDTAATPATTPIAIAPSQTPQQQAEMMQARAITLFQQGHKDQASHLYAQALAMYPQLPSDTPPANTLRDMVVSNYHQQAIVLYRNQQLDQAIALWDKVLAIKPDFEPATVYRTRALELKQRLQKY